MPPGAADNHRHCGLLVSTHIMCLDTEYYMIITIITTHCSNDIIVCNPPVSRGRAADKYGMLAVLWCSSYGGAESLIPA